MSEKLEAKLAHKYNKKTGRKEYALVSKKSGRILKWFGVRKPSEEAFKKEERRVQYYKHLNGVLEGEDIIDYRYGTIPRNKWDQTPHTPYTFQYPHGYPLQDYQAESSLYPTVLAVLASPPLPKLTPPEFWDRNFEQIQDRPGKRLGVEFKAYVEFHRKEFPRGKTIKDQDIIQALNLTSKESSRLPLIWQYLLARKVVKRTNVGDYRLL